MKKFAFLLFILSILIACSHYSELQKNPKESSADEKSHQSGENCMSCHNNANNEASEYWWNIAGTVYHKNGNKQNGVTVELWEKPNRGGKLLKMLVSDKEGNFYTNQIIDFNGGCYPSIKIGTSELNMQQAFTGGSCNSCHGNTTKDKLKIN